MDIGTLTGTITLEDQLSSALTTVMSQVGSFAKNFGGAWGAAAVGVGVAAAAITGALVSIEKLGKKGADINDVSSTLDRFAGSAENATSIVTKMAAGALGTVDNFTLMKSASKLLAGDVKLTADQFGLLSQAAFVLQNEGLGPTEQMLGTLSQALLTGQTRILKRMVGVIDLAKAERDYAKSLGVTELTAMQKVEAARLGILDKLSTKVAEAGILQRDFGEQFEFVSTMIKNWTNNLAQAIAKSPVFNEILISITSSLDKAFGAHSAESIKKLVGMVNSFGIGLITAAQTGVTAADIFIRTWSAVKLAITGVLSIIFSVGTAFTTSVAAIANLASKLPGVGSSFAGVAASAQDTAKFVRETQQSFHDHAAEALEGVKGNSAFQETLGNVSTSLGELKSRLLDAASTQGDATVVTKKHGDALGNVGVISEEAAEKMKKAAAASLQAQRELNDYMRKVSKELYDDRVKAAAAGMERENAVIFKYWTDLYAAKQRLEQDSITRSNDAALHALENQRRNTSDQFKLTEQIEALKLKIVLDANEKKFQSEIALVEEYTELWATMVANFEEAQIAMREAARDAAQQRQLDAEIDSALMMATVVPSKAVTTGWSQVWDGVRGVASTALADLNNIFQKAFEGGGGIGGAVKSLATNLTKGLLSMIPVVGPIVSQFAGAIVAGLSKLGGLFGIGKSEGRKQLEEANAEIKKLQDELLKTYGSLDNIRKMGGAAGQALADAWGSQNVAGLEHFRDVADEFKTALDQQKADVALLNDAIKAYGFSIEELGPALQRQQLGEQALTLAEHWRVLVQAGVDVATVNERMSTAMADYLNMAIKTGTEVPSEMEGIIQSMIDQGALLDDNGNKITNMGELGITFAETMTEGFDRVVDALRLVAEGLGVQVPDALSRATRAAGSFREAGSGVLQTWRSTAQDTNLEIEQIGETFSTVQGMLAAGVTIPVRLLTSVTGAGAAAASGGGGGTGSNDTYKTPSEAREAGVPWRPKSDFPGAYSDSAYKNTAYEDELEARRQASGSYASGTPGLGFMQFGAGTPATLHGSEAVVPESRVDDFVAMHGSGDEASVVEIRRLSDQLQSFLRMQPTLVATAVRDATQLGRRR